MKLADIRQQYQDHSFAMMYYDSNVEQGSLVTAHVIHPKEVTIREDLTVWHEGSCIINGMQDKDKFVVADNLKELDEKIKTSLPEINFKMMKRTKKKL